MGTCKRLPDGSRQSRRRSEYLQVNPGQSATVQTPSGHLQETLRRCQTVYQKVAAPARGS
ncbi:hypothetical protein DPMN_193645 [Dreissena polymorpha]|uniref:Uncharacterized protein n=1 Tax=Dreissena polymorpha TaxID=45954 RepID=A0A9D3XZ57_DREPO|nr:hypothetical protein DPMN_193639 [Dreissena polymorpha]KAH3691045.1 hypothetical protein DPMN_193645 [Dreissena polymorpha]